MPDTFVSVVIPTVRRPSLVTRAVGSVLAQTHASLEVIVVVDGPDQATTDALSAVDDSRVQVVTLPVSMGGAEARNQGVQRATGGWIAFLDDDDEWLPRKLERQLQDRSSEEDVLVTCLSHVVTPLAIYTWPRTIYDNRVPLGDYLFRRNSLVLGESHLQTSTWLIPRRLLLASPFRKLPRHQDWDLVLRLFARPGMRMVTVEEPMVRHYVEDERPSVGRGGDWRMSLEWLDSVSHLFGRRAYSGFVTTVVAQRVVADREWRRLPSVIRRAFERGTPTATQLTALGLIVALPGGLRRHLRALLRQAGLA